MTFPSILATASSIQSTNSTTHSMSLPAGIAAGELLVAIIASDDRPGALGGDIDTWGDLGGDSPGNDAVRIYFKFLRATGSEGSSVGFTTTTAQCTSHRVYRIGGVHESSNPFIGGNNGADASSSVNIGACNPSTWDVEDTLWIFVCANNDGTISVSTFPTSYTNTGQQAADGATDGVNLSWATRNNAVASEDPSAITFSASTACIGALIAIRPSAVTSISVPVINTSNTFNDPLIQNMKLEIPAINAAATMLQPTINLVLVVGSISASASLQTPTVTSLGTQQNINVSVINATAAMQQPTVYHLITVTKFVSQSSDDALEVVGSSPTLEDVLLTASTVSGYLGMRFQSIAVPHNAVLSSAFLTLVIGDTSKNDAEGTWYGEAGDSPGTFTTSDGSVDGRTKTSTSVLWTSDNLGNSGDPVNTPSLVGIVNEIVTRSGWVPSNSMVFLYAHNSTTDQLAVASFDHLTLDAPKLTISYLTFVSTIFAGVISAGASMQQPNIGAVITPGVITAAANVLTPAVNLAIQYVVLTTIIASAVVFDSVVFNATLASNFKLSLNDVPKTASMQDVSYAIALNDPSHAVALEDLVEATLFDQES